MQDHCSAEFRKESGGFRGAHTSQSKCRYFRKPTSPSIQPFGERWLYSEISPKATLHQKRPGGTQNAPQSSRCKISYAASTFQSRPLRGGSATGWISKRSPHWKGWLGRPSQPRSGPPFPRGLRAGAAPERARSSRVPISSLAGSVTAFGPAPSTAINT